MKTITRIHSISLANVFGLAYLLLGIIGGLLLLVVEIIKSGGNDVPLGASLFGIALIILYAILGWVGGYLCALVYNIIAKHFGGIRFDVG